MRKTQVGDELDSYCGRCKMLLRHTVLALVDEVPKRVKCLTCSSQHNHRLVKAGTKTRSSKTKATKAAEEKKSLWAKSVSNWDESKAKQYSPFEKFNVEDFLIHSVFGKGFVSRIPAPDKIIALFELGEKMLLQGKIRN